MGTAAVSQSPAFSPDRRNHLREYFSQSQARFIERQLTEEQLRVIENTRTLSIRDALYVARAKTILGKHPSLAEKIDESYSYTDYTHRREQELPWLDQMKYLIGTRNGHAPTDEEYKLELRRTEMGLFFKVFYCLKFRDKIQRRKAA